VLLRAHTGRSAAEELFEHELWPQARERLAGYLWLYPHDAPARLLLAEALAKDDALSPADAAAQAIDCLESIPDTSPHAAAARLQQGRLCFLILQRPARAEAYLRRSIALEAGLPAELLLWTLLNMTSRPEESEAVFWRVYEQSSEEERPLRLREWYLNQFFPLSANETLDRALGILAPQETPTRMTESRRYLRFREQEPEAPLNHAAVALWCQEEGDPEFALRVLDAAAKELPQAQSDPLFLSTTIAAHIDMGHFEDAETAFRQWPEHDRGQAYWKWRAIVLDEVLHQHAEALAAYERALALWPGPADWRLHHRQAGCLARLRKPDEAAAAKQRAEQVEALMKADVHERLRASLRSLDDATPLAEIIQFYRDLGRDREADAWERHVRRLTALAAKREGGGE
jgi:tetratricopeptide (TPR) repeat protein